MITLLDAATTAVHGNERQVVREDARQVIFAARECLDGGDMWSASFHVPAVEAVIANLLPICTGRTRQSSLATAVVDHARALVDGAHVSQGYPAQWRLRVLLHSAYRLLVISQATPRRLLRWRRRLLLSCWHGRTSGGNENQTGIPTPRCSPLLAGPQQPALKRVGR
ncbi:hypothetical protein [Streptomyces noursei]|uniref:hypothetical protein n=1 Tax=Streptomyces noursei TaxID=1971 RepID=UPI00190F2150|nr:hypothetical protein [Streptomyces noursei]